MSFKDMFYKAPEESKPEKITTIKPTLGTNNGGISPLGSISAGVYTAPTQIDATSSDEFNQYLAKIMDDANLPGPDYYEFSKAMDTLRSSPLTEEQKYATIYAAFGAQGVTPQGLVDAAQKYIAILGQKKSSEFDTSVQSAELAIKNREESIRIFGEENVKLSSQIADNAKRIAELTEEMSRMKTKVEVKKTTFNMSYQNFINKIMGDIENIKKYLINGSVTK